MTLYGIPTFRNIKQLAGGSCFHTGKVTGSIPVRPTIVSNGLTVRHPQKQTLPVQPAITLTWAAITFQPSGVRIQVWL